VSGPGEGGIFHVALIRRRRFQVVRRVESHEISRIRRQPAHAGRSQQVGPSSGEPNVRSRPRTPSGTRQHSHRSRFQPECKEPARSRPLPRPLQDSQEWSRARAGRVFAGLRDLPVPRRRLDVDGAQCNTRRGSGAKVLPAPRRADVVVLLASRHHAVVGRERREVTIRNLIGFGRSAQADGIRCTRRTVVETVTLLSSTRSNLGTSRSSSTTGAA